MIEMEEVGWIVACFNFRQPFPGHPRVGIPEARLAFVAHLRERGEITTQEFKDLVGATRKHVIPLAEYFDREKVTLRVGERRVLRGDGSRA